MPARPSRARSRLSVPRRAGPTIPIRTPSPSWSKACNANGLFPPFYAPIFEAVGTIRNKMGDAHGRGPTPLYAVAKEHADHMLQMTSAHITLLVRLAGI